MEPTERLTNLEELEAKPEYAPIQPDHHPAYWGVDLDPTRRPGVPKLRKDPRPWPNARYPIERQPGEPSAPKHGRPNKPMPPVFGTAVPLHGLSGAIRRVAYRYPDHRPRHWLLKMLGDRVDSWEARAPRLAAAGLLLTAGALISRRLMRR
jgi:hypothetical protein